MAGYHFRLSPNTDDYEDLTHALRAIKTTDDLHKTYKPVIPTEPEKKLTSILRNRQTEDSFNQNDVKAGAECTKNDCKDENCQPLDVSTAIGPSLSILDLTLDSEQDHQEGGSTTTIIAVEELDNCRRSLSCLSLLEDSNDVSNDQRITSGRTGCLKFSQYSNSECKSNKSKDDCKRQETCDGSESSELCECELYERSQNHGSPQLKKNPDCAEYCECELYERSQNRGSPELKKNPVYPEYSESEAYQRLPNHATSKLTQPSQIDNSVYSELPHGSPNHGSPNHGSPNHGSPKLKQNPVYPMRPSRDSIPELQKNQHDYESDPKPDYAEYCECELYERSQNNGSPELKKNPVYPEYSESEAYHRLPNHATSKLTQPSQIDNSELRSESRHSSTESQESSRKTERCNRAHTFKFAPSNCTNYTDEAFLSTQVYDCCASMDDNEDDIRCSVRARSRGMTMSANSHTDPCCSGSCLASCSSEDTRRDAACNCVDIETFLANRKKSAAQCCDPCHVCCDPCHVCCPIFSPPCMRPCPTCCKPPEDPPCPTNECFCMGYVHDMLEDRSVYAVSYRPVMCCGNNFNPSSEGHNCLCSDLPLGGGCGPCRKDCPTSPCCFATQSPSCCDDCRPSCGGCTPACLYPLARLSPGYCNYYRCGGCNAYCF